MDEEMKNQIDLRIKKLVPEILKGPAFTDRKITDTPVDSLAVVNRRYVTLNGATANRPIGSVATIGQRFYDTTINKPIYWTAGGWRDSTSSIVGF